MNSMFNLFNKRNFECPIDWNMRLWMEQAFLWLVGQFGEQNILSKNVILPTKDFFPIRYDGSKESLLKTAEIVAKQMEINLHQVNLQTFKESIHELQVDSVNRLFTNIDEQDKVAAGLYFDKSVNGKFDVFIEENGLLDPEGLVATLAHEFAHIKILGEKRLEFNDEYLTDLTTAVFGLGIFNSNSYFKFYKGYDGWQHKTSGYLNQQEWGYALAIYAYFREERSPQWIKHLSSNLKKDFKKSENFIYANMDKVFMEEYTGQVINR